MAKQKDINNRNNLRIANQTQVISLLRRTGSLPISSISEKLNISFVATTAIVEELVNHGLLTASKKKNDQTKKGRAPVFLSINENAGVTAAIDLSSNSLSVALFDLRERLLCQAEIPHVDFVEEKHFQELADLLSSLLKRKEVRGRKLLGIAIASPGMINSLTGEYAMVYRVKDYLKINPRTYFANLYNVPTKLYNDVRVASIAEKIFAPSFSMKNFLFIHIGMSSGLALFLNDKLYGGAHGYSGEISIYNPVDEISKNTRHNKLYSLGRLYQRIIEEKGLDHKKEMNVDEILAWQKEGDPVAMKFIDESARYNAIAIIGYADLLDLEGVVLEGPIVALGESYRNLLLKYVNLYNAHEVRVRIHFSELKQNNTLLGGAYLANNRFFLSAIEDITRKRLSYEPDDPELQISASLVC